MIRDDFEKLALKHLDAVYRMAMHLSHHPDDAADLVQETYLKALRAADGFEERGGGIRPWLFKILQNVFYTRVSRIKRGPLAIDEFHGLADDDPGPGEPAPAWNLDAFDWEQVDERLKGAIENLQPEYRVVLLLWGVEGMKYRQIAEIEGIPIGTVMSRLYRARNILARELSDFAHAARPYKSISTIESSRTREHANGRIR